MPQLLSVIKLSDSYIIQKLQSICKSYPMNFLNFCISICIKQKNPTGEIHLSVINNVFCFCYFGSFFNNSSKYSGNGAENSI